MGSTKPRHTGKATGKVNACLSHAQELSDEFPRKLHILLTGTKVRGRKHMLPLLSLQIWGSTRHGELALQEDSSSREGRATQLRDSLSLRTSERKGYTGAPKRVKLLPVCLSLLNNAVLRGRTLI